MELFPPPYQWFWGLPCTSNCSFLAKSLTIIFWGSFPSLLQKIHQLLMINSLSSCGLDFQPWTRFQVLFIFKSTWGNDPVRGSLVTLPTFGSLVTLPTLLGRVASDPLVLFLWPCSLKNTSPRILFLVVACDPTYLFGRVASDPRTNLTNFFWLAHIFHKPPTSAVEWEENTELAPAPPLLSDHRTPGFHAHRKDLLISG